MTMIVYMKTDGVAHDIRRVPKNYKMQEGELLCPGDVVLAPDELSDVIPEKPIYVDPLEAVKKRLEAVEADVGTLKKAVKAG